MKKALIYSVLILFLANSMGYYFLFELTRELTRSEMQSMIKSSPARLTILTIQDTEKDHDFHRVDSREFTYKSIMYDIVREIKSGEKTVFICVHDTKETNLFAGFKRINQNKLHFPIFDHLNMICKSERAHELSPSFSGNMNFPIINILVKSSMLQTWSPPPEQC